MERLAGVLLEVDPDEADRASARGRVDLDLPAGREGPVVLGDLVSLGQVRVEVVLPREPRVALDLGPDGAREAQRERHGMAVEDRERAGKPETDRAGGGIGAARRP